MYGDPSWRVPKGLNLKRVIVDWTTITGHALRDVRSILDANYLHRDPALAEAAIRKLESRTKIPDRAPDCA
jgi:hypothetical protein